MRAQSELVDDQSLIYPAVQMYHTLLVISIEKCVVESLDIK